MSETAAGLQLIQCPSFEEFVLDGEFVIVPPPMDTSPDR